MKYPNKIPTENPEDEVLRKLPTKPKTWNPGEWNRVGKSISVNFTLDKSAFFFWDFKNQGDNAIYHKPGKNKFKYPNQPKKDIKNLTSEFNKYHKAQAIHTYLKNKCVNPTNLNIKQITVSNQSLLVVPVYNKEGIIISFQYISEAQTDNKKFKSGCPIAEQTPHFPIGEDTKEFVYVAEGMATGATIHEITGKRVYCSFSKDNIDNVVTWLIKKYPKSFIVRCIDNDKENTLKTIYKTKQVITLCPETAGDFNDSKNSSQEIYKLQNPDTCQYLKRMNKTIKETTYIDENGKQLMRGYVGILCGEKGAMKSKGILSYLSSNKIKTAYFSAGEITEEQANSIDKAHILTDGHTKITGNEQMYIHWLDFNNKDTMKNIDKIIKKHKIQIVVEDPPLLNKEMAKMEGLQKYITSRAKIAERHNIAWLCTKNFAKADYKNILNKVSGFALWTSIPRYLIGVWQIEEGHELRNPQAERDKHTGEVIKPDKPLPKSLFQMVVNNVTDVPKKSLILEFKEVEIRQEGVTGTVDVGVTEISKIDRVKKPDIWVKKPDNSNEEKWNTEIWQILHYIYEQKENGGVKSATLVAKMCNKDFLSLSESKAYRIIRMLKKQKFIQGGGIDKKAPYTLTQSGINHVDNYDDES